MLNGTVNADAHRPSPSSPEAMPRSARIETQTPKCGPSNRVRFSASPGLQPQIMAIDAPITADPAARQGLESDEHGIHYNTG